MLPLEIEISIRAVPRFALPGLMLALLVGCDGGNEPAPTVAAVETETEVRPPAKRPNIIFLIADDQAARTLGFEGNTHIRTPNLDRMAAQGTYFSRMYVPVPQCAPSRAALLTGRYPHAIGAMSNKLKTLPPDAVTIAQHLKSAGYRCGMVGKWHQGDPLKPQAGFEDFWVTRDKDARPKKDKYVDPVLVFNGQREEHKGYLTDVLTDFAIRFIDEPSEKPFMLWLSYYAPHEPFTAHPDFPYDPDEVPEPDYAADDLSTKPPAQRESICHQLFKRSPTSRIRSVIADYYSMISAVDANVGRILSHLESRELQKDTLVVYLSDNGWFNGEHQLLLKGPMFYEELVHMPLILWQPGTVPDGQTCDALVSSLDIFSTALGRAGVANPDNADGVDLWPLVDGSATSVRESVFMEFLEKGSTGDVEPMLGVVNGKHKYVRYLRSGQEELYDLQRDPFELINLIDRSDHIGVLAQQRLRVDEFAATIDPPFWER